MQHSELTPEIFRPQPQNPVTHDGSMVFAEHGRLAQLNPLVLKKMFTDAEGNPRVQDEEGRHMLLHGAGGEVESRMKAIFAPDADEYDFSESIMATAFLVSKVIFVVMKSSLTRQETIELPSLIREERDMLQKCFSISSNTQNLARAPNIHLGCHLTQDIHDFATLKNVSAMIGEQMHKIHKAQAPHTNSRDTELQLMKSTNLTVSLRFVAAGVHTDHPLATRLRTVLSQCPVISNYLVGDEQTMDQQKQPLDGMFKSSLKVPAGVINTSKTLRQRDTSTEQRDLDLKLLKPAFDHGRGLVWDGSFKSKFRYFERVTMKAFLKHQFSTKVISICIDNPIRLGTRISTKIGTELAIVQRIFEVEIPPHGKEVYLTIKPLIRDQVLETSATPYHVYRYPAVNELTPLNSIACISLTDVIQENVHLVSRIRSETTESWWLNPYVTEFL